MNALISRLAQPSTYAGFSGLALAFGLSQPQFAAYATAAATLFGLIAVALNETGGAA
jgi:hypothetical protein